MNIQNKSIALNDMKENRLFFLTHDDEFMLENITTLFDIENENLLIKGTVEQNGFIIIPIELPVMQEQKFSEIRLLLGINTAKNILFIIQPKGFAILDNAIGIAKKIKLAEDKAFYLVNYLNSYLHETNAFISNKLDLLHEKILATNAGTFQANKNNETQGVADIAEKAISFNESEEVLSHLIEALLMTERCVRWLRRVSVNEVESVSKAKYAIDLLKTIKKQAMFNHSRIKNLQQSLMTTLDLKQNHVLKIFTIITAVFTPPTLIGAFYGQNFSYMPELKIVNGEILVIIMTGVFALLPMWYIKKKGWLR